jgi:hypothetical protein
VGLELRRAGQHPAALIDDRRDPGIGRAQQIAAGLARPHARDLEVLVGGERVAEPGIVADIDEQLGRW